MPINVSCTSCGTTLRAPDTAAGKKVKCPKCGAVLIVPTVEEVLEDAPVSVSESPAPPPRRNRQYDPDDDDRPRRRDRRDDDDDEPRPRPRRQPVATTEETGGGAQFGLGIASLSVGIVGVLLSLIPCIGLCVGTPFAVIGFLLGAVGLIIAMTQKGRGIAFPAAGTVVSLSAGVILGIWMISAGTFLNQGAQQFKKGLDEMAERARKKEEADKQKEEADRQKSKENLSRLAKAMRKYAKVNGGRLPKSDNKGLSWRVLILPYLNEEPLFKEFNLEQAFDGQQNQPLLTRRPEIYKPVRNDWNNDGTYYLVFAGQDGPFGQGKQPTLGQFAAGVGAGPANTFLIVEGGLGMKWSQPQDEWYDKNGQVPQLGSMFGNSFHAAMADGTVRWFNRGALTNDQMRAAILSDPKGPRLPNP